MTGPRIERLHFTVFAVYNIIRHGRNNILEREIQKLYDDSTHWRTAYYNERKKNESPTSTSCLDCGSSRVGTANGPDDHSGTYQGWS